MGIYISESLEKDREYLRKNNIPFMTIGEKIKKSRKDAGLLQKELAEKSGVSLVTISQYERNLRVPAFEQFCKLAKIIDLDGWTLPFSPGHDIVIKKITANEAGGLTTVLSEVSGVSKPQQHQWREEINNDLDKLNNLGKQEAAKRIREMTYIPSYTQTVETETHVYSVSIPEDIQSEVDTTVHLLGN